MIMVNDLTGALHGFGSSCHHHLHHPLLLQTTANPGSPGKWPLKRERERERERDGNNDRTGFITQIKVQIQLQVIQHNCVVILAGFFNHRAIVWTVTWCDKCLSYFTFTFVFCLFLELLDSSPVTSATTATSSPGIITTCRPMPTLAADTHPTSSLSSSLVSPSMKLGDDGHATHLVPRLAPPSTLSMRMSFTGFSHSYRPNASMKVNKK